MERKNGPLNPKPVEVNNVYPKGENVVTPTYAFVRLGQQQRVRVSLPMSTATLEVLAAVATKHKKG